MPILHVLPEPAARTLLDAKTAGMSDLYAAERRADGWLFSARPPLRPSRRWVVADTGGCCHLDRDADPDTVLHRLRVAADVAGAAPFDHDTLLCSCGHRSGLHGYGEPTPDPRTGKVTGIGRGPCGWADPDLFGYVLTSWRPCECERLDPVGSAPAPAPDTF